MAPINVPHLLSLKCNMFAEVSVISLSVANYLAKYQPLHVG